MVRLEKSQILNRPIRKDDWSELGIPTIIKIKEAMEAGRKDEALELLDYLIHEGKFTWESSRDWAWAWATYVADTYGEEEIFRLYREAAESLAGTDYLSGFRAMDVEEQVRWWVDLMMSLRSGKDQDGTITIKEEADRFVLSFNPCGSGGKMRRPDPQDGTPARTEPPYCYGVTKKARPETWQEAGVSYYCTHCAWVNELLGIELFGTPNFITEWTEDPDQPCRHIFYKKPELIPEAYYERLGKKKPR